MIRGLSLAANTRPKERECRARPGPLFYCIEGRIALYKPEAVPMSTRL